MNKKFLISALLFFALPALAQSDTQWVLEQSTLSYHMSHPVHEVDGVSHAAKGKGVCHAGQCDFLIAAPVKSFDSGDSNRDLRLGARDQGQSHWNGCNQSQSLMDLQHVCALVQQRLLLGIALCLRGRKT